VLVRVCDMPGLMSSEVINRTVKGPRVLPSVLLLLPPLQTLELVELPNMIRVQIHFLCKFITILFYLYYIFLASFTVCFIVIHQELAMMKQVLISMRSRQGETLNVLETDRTGIGASGSGKQQSKRINRTTEEESPTMPKPTVFVSVSRGDTLL